METSVGNRGNARAPENWKLTDVEYAYLLGTPPLREFKEFVRARCPALRVEDEHQLIAAWGTAVQRLRELALTERGCVDDADLLKLPASLLSTASNLLAQPAVAASLGPVSCRWAMVNLDQLVVHQRSVDLSYVESLRREFSPRLTDTDLFALAAGELQSRPAVGIVRNSNTLTFSSVSSDLRFLGSELRVPEHEGGSFPPGRPVRVVALYVGYGINVLSALRVDRRLILINGTHRCHALYEMGLKEVPCLVREVSSDDDLELIDAPELKQNLSIYLRSPRPPRLKDFFDPIIRTVIRAPAMTRLVHVQIITQESKAARVLRPGELG